jgi:hypothetical protein
MDGYSSNNSIGGESNSRTQPMTNSFENRQRLLEVTGENRSRNNSLFSNNSAHSGSLLQHFNLSQFEAEMDNRSDYSQAASIGNASNSNMSQKSQTSNVSDTLNVALTSSNLNQPHHQQHYNVNNNSIANSVSSFISEANT